MFATVSDGSLEKVAAKAMGGQLHLILTFDPPRLRLLNEQPGRPQFRLNSRRVKPVHDLDHVLNCLAKRRDVRSGQVVCVQHSNLSCVVERAGVDAESEARETAPPAKQSRAPEVTP